jgi:ABC-type glucose/galactose transport system permease subunit
MLQVFYLNVAKVDLNVAYVAMTIHACFKCFICFRRMLQVFRLDVSKTNLVGAHVVMAWCCCCVGHRIFQK